MTEQPSFVWTPPSPSRPLRDYQQVAMVKLRDAVKEGIRRIVLQTGTGGGKTRIAAEIARNAIARGKRLAFVVPALDLIDQTVVMFALEGVTEVGVIQAQHVMTDWGKPIQICSIQTLLRRSKLPEVDIVVIDECHVQYKALLKWLSNPDWKHIPFIGLSATPWARGMGKYWELLINAGTIARLTQDEWLSRYRIFAPYDPDLSAVRVRAGDYVEEDLSKAMNKAMLTADIIRTWRKHWGVSKTLIFCVDRAHARAVTDQFLEAGHRFVYQDGNTPLSERAQNKRDFHDGSILGVVSIGTMIMGIDWDVRCLVWARPTKSEILYIQGTGRVLRPAPDKPWALILDHAGNSLRLGLPEDIQHDTLDMGEPKKKGKAREKPKWPLPKPCPQCSFMLTMGQKRFPVCEYVFKPRPTTVTVDADAQLHERGTKPMGRRVFSDQEKLRFFCELRGWAARSSYKHKDGWAAHKFKDRFGHWPLKSWNMASPAEPSPETVRWIHGQNAAYHMRVQKLKQTPYPEKPPLKQKQPTVFKNAMESIEQWREDEKRLDERFKERMGEEGPPW